MELAGKKVLFLGDSITEGTGTSAPEFHYPSVFARLSGADVTAYGVGGTRITPQKKSSAEPRWDLDFIQRADGMREDADVVVVFGGTNDFGHADTVVGTESDREPTTFYGACHTLFRKLLTKYSDATIVVMTPLHRTSENDLINEIGLPREPLSTYVTALRNVATYYSLPVCDLYNVSGLQPNVPVIQQKYMPDGLHPNDAGAARIAERLYGFLKSL